MKKMSRELEYYYKNREKISKKRKTKEFAEKRRKYQSEHNKTCRRSRKILIELEEWLKEQGNNGIDEWGNHYTVCLYKLNKLKEKYK